MGDEYCVDYEVKSKAKTDQLIWDVLNAMTHKEFDNDRMFRLKVAITQHREVK